MNENNIDKENIESYENIVIIYTSDIFSENYPKIQIKITLV